MKSYFLHIFFQGEKKYIFYSKSESKCGQANFYTFREWPALFERMFNNAPLYRVFENEGDTENGCKIGILDHLFGISVLYTSERYTIFMLGMEFLIFTMQKTIK